MPRGQGRGCIAQGGFEAEGAPQEEGCVIFGIWVIGGPQIQEVGFVGRDAFAVLVDSVGWAVGADVEVAVLDAWRWGDFVGVSRDAADA